MSNPEAGNSNGNQEKNYEFVRPVPAFILGAIIMHAAAVSMLDRKAGMMKSDYRGEITIGVYIYLFLALIYSIFFFLKEARASDRNSKFLFFLITGFCWLRLS